MLKNYFKIAYRSLIKNKTYSLINIIGLSLGLSCCITILLYVQDETSYDNFYENEKDLYRLVLERKYPDHVTNYAIIPAGFSEILAEEIPEIKESTRLVGFPNFGATFKYEDNVFEEKWAFFADSNFFRVLDFDLLQGDPNTALTNPNSIILTESSAQKYFGSDDPIGKTIDANGVDVEVVGIMQDIPENSHIKFEFLTSTSALGFLAQPNYIAFSSYNYVLLEEGADKSVVEAKLPAVVEKYAAGQIERNLGVSYAEYQAAGNGYVYTLQPISDIHLTSNMDAEIKPNGNIVYVYIFISIAIFILVLAGINFVNLATAKSAERAKEVGLRKVMGSNRQQLIAQFLAESVFITVISLIVSIALIQAVLPYFNSLASKSLELDLFSSGFIIPALLLFVVMVGILAGLYPSFYISSLQPVEVVKGKFKSNAKGKILRNGLVVFQFAISMILVTGTLIVFDQMEFIQNKRLGYNTENVLVLERINTLDQPDSFIDAVENLPDVRAVTSASSMPDGFFFGTQFQLPGQADVFTTKGMTVDDAYFSTMEVNLAEGRPFSEDFSDSLNLILNQTAVETFGLSDPIGEVLSTSNPLPDGTNQIVNYTIVGVVEDFNFESLRTSITPLAIFSDESQVGGTTFMPIRFESSNTQQTIAAVENLWDRFNPGEPFIYTFLDTQLNQLYAAEERSGTLLGLFASLAIVIACIGLFGLAAYMAYQRTKEIGVRKVLGASVFGIIVLLSKEFTKLIGISFLVAVPVSYVLMEQWLQNFAYRTEMTLGTFLISGVLALLVAILTVSGQSIKAATTNPVNSLKSE